MTATTTATRGGPAVRVPAARPGPRAIASQSLLIARRNLTALVRAPETIFFSVIQPIMFLLLFNYVFGGVIGGEGGGYINFLMPGILVQFVAFATFSTALGLNSDVAKGFVDRFRSLPIARSAVLTGRILSDAVGMAFNTVLLGAVGTLMGFRISGGLTSIIGACLLAWAFGVALCWVGAVIGLTLRSPEAVQSGGMSWLFPLTFASSAFAPAESMPGWLQAFVNVNPVTITTDAIRALLAGEPAASLALASLAWTVAITAV
ncbi:MAG: ABC transporter permease, partial [Egibacteraceae bacterium]